eukprot:PhM_4_TR17079/c0_g1_i1/m.87245
MISINEPTDHSSHWSFQVNGSLSWENVTYDVDIPADKTTRCILRRLSGTAHPSRILAIMGPSGSGKTTLLNCIANRMEQDASHRFSGHICIDGVPYVDAYRRVMSFVSQDDVVFDTDTPREALYFNARIKTGISHLEAVKSVEQTLDHLRMGACADTVIGTPGVSRGISGGERKRTNIGAEIITNPRILLLDEPTTGLDSVTSRQVLTTLRELAEDHHRTVLCTIHQPSSELFALFDDVLLLSAGRVVFQGPREEAKLFFAQHGYVVPPHNNPSDFYMRILQQEHSDVAMKLADAWEHQQKQQQENVSSIDTSVTDATKAGLLAYSELRTATVRVQAKLLLQRSLRSFFRSDMALRARFGQTLFLSVLMGLIFLQMPNDQAGVQDRIGLLFLACMNQGMLAILTGIVVFPPERAIFLREQANGAYNPFVYAFTKIIAEMPMQILFPVLFCCILYWMAGLRAAADAFFLFVVGIILVANTAQSFGLLITAAFDNVETALAIVPVFVLPFALVGGLAVNTSRLTPYWSWLGYISFIRYGFIFVAVNELSPTEEYNCDVGSVCRFRSGDDVLRYLGFEDESMWFCAVLMCVMIVVLRCCTAALLAYQAKQKRGM